MPLSNVKRGQDTSIKSMVKINDKSWVGAITGGRPNHAHTSQHTTGKSDSTYNKPAHFNDITWCVWRSKSPAPATIYSAACWFPAQRASSARCVTISWGHRVIWSAAAGKMDSSTYSISHKICMWSFNACYVGIYLWHIMDSLCVFTHILQQCVTRSVVIIGETIGRTWSISSGI